MATWFFSSAQWFTESPFPRSAVIKGLAAGLAHHSLCTVYYGSDIFTAIVFWLFSNLFFLVSVLSEVSLPSNVSGRAVVENVAQFNIGYIAFVIVSKFLYNVYFRHRGIPARFPFCLSDLNLWSYGKRGIAHLTIKALHDELGDVVRIQPDHISFRSVTAIGDIHSAKASTKKGALYLHLFRAPKAPPSLINIVDNERHAFLRRIIGVSFSNTAMNRFQGTLQIYSMKLMEAIERIAMKNNGIVDMNDWFHRFSFDIVGVFAYGQSFEALDGGEQHPCIQAIQRSVPLLGFFYYIPWAAKFLRMFPPTQTRKNSRLAVLNVKNAIQRWQDKLREKEEDHTIVGNIMQTIDPQTGKKFTTRDLLTTGATFINAGSDTTAVTLTFLLYHLLAKREYWNRLVIEVFDNITSPDEIFKSQFNLPFLNACVSEILRYRPPVPSNLQREVAYPGAYIDGHYLPGGTTVSTPLYAILHDSRYFYQPESFLPERWLVGELKDHPMNKDAWFPFSKGPRNCVGKILALQEVKKCMALFVWYFDAYFVESDQKEPYYLDCFSVKRGPLPLKIYPRKAQKLT